MLTQASPGMGLNAYFTYQVVGFHGTGSVTYGLALTAVFVEGFIFVFLALIGMRQWLVKVIPSSIKLASGAGIGLFLTEIGLSYSAGIGLITGSFVTPTDLGGCLPQYRDPATGDCLSHKMASPTVRIISPAQLYCNNLIDEQKVVDRSDVWWSAHRVSNVLQGEISYHDWHRCRFNHIMAVCHGSVSPQCLSLLKSFSRDTPFTYFPRTTSGNTMFSFFQKVVTFQPIQHLLNANDWDVTQAGRHFALALFTFLYVDIIDASATLYSMAKYARVVNEETGDFPRSTIAYCTDALTISIGSLFGVSPSTVFIESGAGIAEGGRTGLTAMTTGLCFLISIFFAPIFASIPPWATGCTLVIVGCLMMTQVQHINWRYFGDALPAFVTIATMPLSYSVAYGLIAGVFTYTVLNGLIWFTDKASGGRWQPPDFDQKQVWTAVPEGGTLPWFVRVAQKKIWSGRREANDGESVAANTEASELELVDADAKRGRV